LVVVVPVEQRVMPLDADHQVLILSFPASHQTEGVVVDLLALVTKTDYLVVPVVAVVHLLLVALVALQQQVKDILVAMLAILLDLVVVAAVVPVQ
jgi:hypothetical protein